jgi:hypothetical protein
VTPETRAARDRLARYAGPDFQPPPIDLPRHLNCLTIAEVERLIGRIESDIRDTLAPDIRAIVEALDQHDEAEKDI